MPIVQTDSQNRLTFFRGDSHTVELTVKKKNPANPTGPLIVQDLTGATAVLTVKIRATDSTALVQKVGAFVNPPGTDGKLRFEFVPVDTINIQPGPYVYDIQISLPLGKVYTVVKGTCDLMEDVTNLGDVLPTPIPLLPGTFTRVFSVLMPVAADTSGVHAAYAASGAALAFPGPLTQPGHPRSLRVTFDSGWDGGNVTVIGTNQFDEAISETFNTAPGSTVEGAKAFKTVTSITKQAVGVTANAASVGVGDKLGIYGKLSDEFNAQLFANNVACGATLNATYHTFIPELLPDGSTNYTLIANFME